MNRDVYKELMTWKTSARRKPLLLKGARQTGKTWLLKEFGKKAYENCAYFNFEEDAGLKAFFSGRLDPRRLIENLSVYQGRSIHPGKDILIFDEIQTCNEALNALKYFQEDAGDYHVAAAGSLLGVKLSAPNSFPVGKVNFIHLHPMSFAEFLDAVGEHRYREVLENTAGIEPVPEPFHEELTRWLRIYYYVGGMPEAVAHYANTRDLAGVRQIQKEILDSYILDFAKHAPTSDIPRLSHIWDSIPSQLARENKKFIFSAVRKSARSREYESAVRWLEDAGLIHRSFLVAAVRQPLKGYMDRDCFKVYTLDVGLLGAMSGLPMDVVVQGDRLFTEFKGSLVENYVAQQLCVLNIELFYWKPAGGVAEVDFILSLERDILPLEVKAGVNPKSKSLRSYEDRFHPSLMCRATLLNFKKEAVLWNIPLYAVSCIPRLAAAHKGDQEMRQPS
jgi:uncharacterized protein